MSGPIPPSLPDNGGQGGQRALPLRLGYIALCVCSVLVFAALLNAVTLTHSVAENGYEGMPPARVTLAALEQSDAAHRILFVGNSQFFRGIDTDALDAALAEEGCEAASFIVAYPIMNVQEEADILNAVAAMGERGPTTVALAGDLAPLNYRTNPLAIEPSSFLSQVRFELTGDGMSRRGKLALAYDYVRALGLSLLGYVRLEQLWPQPPINYEDTVRGFYPYREGDTILADAVREGIAARHAARAQADGLPIVPVAFSDHELPDYLFRRAARAGGDKDVIIMTMPALDHPPENDPAPTGWQAVTRNISTLNINSTALLPAMLDDAFWQDRVHASPSGAAQISRALAPYLCPVAQVENNYALR